MSADEPRHTPRPRPGPDTDLWEVAVLMRSGTKWGTVAWAPARALADNIAEEYAAAHGAAQVWHDGACVADYRPTVEASAPRRPT